MTWFVVAVYAVMSGITFLAYALDKRRAVHEQRRIAEKTLHLLELFGGWPGALAAQAAVRHKTQKLRFKVVLWAIIALHTAAWVAYWRWR